MTKEEDKKRNTMFKVGDCQGYINEDCENCGRHRVEHYSMGFDICEKCRWCKQLKRYISDEEFYRDDDAEETDSWLEHMK